MQEHDEPISNIEQAKRYFISMGCSHFQLCREDSQKAKEYYALKIDSDIESRYAERRCRKSSKMQIINHN